VVIRRLNRHERTVLPGNTVGRECNPDAITAGFARTDWRVPEGSVGWRLLEGSVGWRLLEGVVYRQVKLSVGGHGRHRRVLGCETEAVAAVTPRCEVRSSRRPRTARGLWVSSRHDQTSAETFCTRDVVLETSLKTAGRKDGVSGWVGG
jgi:hypothetical protein